MKCPYKGYHKSEKTDSYELEVFSSVEDFPEDCWEKFFASDDPFCSRDYFIALERESGLVPRYILAREMGTPVFAAYFQIVDFTGQSLAQAMAPEDGPMSLSAGRILKLFSSYFYNRQWKLLICGNALNPSKSGLGRCSLPLEKQQNYLKASINLMKAGARKHEDIKAVLVPAVLNEERAQVFKGNSFRDVVTDPEMVVDRLGDWDNYDQYLQALSSKYRVRAKKAMKKSKDVTTHELDEDALVLHMNTMDELYSNVVDSARLCLVRVDPEYYLRVKRALGDEFKVYGYFLEGELIGFITYMVGSSETDVHLIGLNYNYTRSHSLYSRILYDSIERAISYGCSKAYFGRTATEIKSTIGAVPVDSKAYFRTTNKVSNAALRPLRKLVKPQEWVFRSPFKTTTSEAQ